MTRGKHSPYKYRPTLPSETGKYASQHGVAAATKSFSRKLEEQGETFHGFQRSFCDYAHCKLKPHENTTHDKNFQKENFPIYSRSVWEGQMRLLSSFFVCLSWGTVDAVSTYLAMSGHCRGARQLQPGWCGPAFSWVFLHEGEVIISGSATLYIHVEAKLTGM